MQVKFKKLQSNAIIPSYATEGDCGLDLVATSKQYVEKHEFLEYGTGIAIEIPEGYGGFLFPRSSISKRDLTLCNSVGVIDPGYRGEIKLRFKFTAEEGFAVRSYQVGDKIGQLIIMERPKIELFQVNELSDSERGTDGFGSTGN